MSPLPHTHNQRSPPKCTTVHALASHVNTVLQEVWYARLRMEDRPVSNTGPGALEGPVRTKRPFSIESIMGLSGEPAGPPAPPLLVPPEAHLPWLYHSWLAWRHQDVVPLPLFYSQPAHHSDDSRSDSRSPVTPHDLTLPRHHTAGQFSSLPALFNVYLL